MLTWSVILNSRLCGKLFQQISTSNKRCYSGTGYSSTRRVVVTGLGCVTPLGGNASASWDKLTVGGCAISKLVGKSFEGLPSQVAARVDVDSLKLDQMFLKTERKTMTQATTFALVAAREALQSSGLIDANKSLKDNIGVCVGMGMLDLSDIYNAHQSLIAGYKRLSPFFIPRILPNMSCGQISMKYGLRGPNHSVSTACATGAHAIGDGYRFIKYGDADIMVCGSGESCIDPLSIAGFCRLKALSTIYNDTPEKASRPFDTSRDGFVIGEGSAILVLEELNHAKNRGASIFAEVLGYGLSGDASHLTAPSEDGLGAFLAMSRALKDAKIESTQISYVNAHATSTPIGDKIEVKAIEKVLQSRSNEVFVSSTKGAHGHLLGASGSLETLFLVLACKNKILPPSLNIEKTDDNVNVQFIKETMNWECNHRRIALKNSFGFGGTNASLCVAEYLE